MIFIRATFPDIAYTEVYRGLYSGEKHEEKQFAVYLVFRTPQTTRNIPSWNGEETPFCTNGLCYKRTGVY